MTLTDRERVIAIIANGIAVFSMLQSGKKDPELSGGAADGLPADVDSTNMYDFVLKMTPEELKPVLSASLIDEVFEYVSSSHSS